MLAISTRSPQYAELLRLLQLLLLLLLLLPSLGITIAVKIVRHKNSRNPIKCLQQEQLNVRQINMFRNLCLNEEDQRTDKKELNCLLKS